MKVLKLLGASPVLISLLLLSSRILFAIAFDPFIDIAIDPSNEAYHEVVKRAIERIFGGLSGRTADYVDGQDNQSELRLTEQEIETSPASSELRKRQNPRDDEVPVEDPVPEEFLSNEATIGESPGLMELEQVGESPQRDPSRIEFENWFESKDTNLDDFAIGQQSEFVSGSLDQIDLETEAPAPRDFYQAMFMRNANQQDGGGSYQRSAGSSTYRSSNEPKSFLEQQYAMPQSGGNLFSSPSFGFGPGIGSNLGSFQNMARENNFDTTGVLNRPSNVEAGTFSERTIPPPLKAYSWSMPQQVIEDIMDPTWVPNQKAASKADYQQEEAIRLHQPKNYARQKFTAIQRCGKLRDANPPITRDEAASYNKFLDVYGYPVINPPADSLGPYLPNTLSDPALNFYQNFLSRFQVAEKEILGADGQPTGVAEPVIFEPARNNYGCNAIVYKEKRFCELRASAKAASRVDERERGIGLQRPGKYLWYSGTPYQGLTPVGYKVLDYFVTKRGLHNSFHWTYRACGVKVKLMLPADDITLSSFRWKVAEPRPAFAVPGSCLMSMLESKTFPCPEVYNEQIRPMIQANVEPWASSAEDDDGFPRLEDLVPVGEWERRWLRTGEQWRSGMVVPTTYDNNITPPLK
ncbi:hypothetical protein Dda_4165 [Drechslerella dactyloides]|uniref:Uncharacterized protein n=1 Tax=Drechslerella dactyloides TaxID=74499 RepID=A0AAD6J1K5_DREDA|nr:hypothetical protein Dda_4165 [Drechslerella dactyloides]